MEEEELILRSGISTEIELVSENSIGGADLVSGQSFSMSLISAIDLEEVEY